MVPRLCLSLVPPVRLLCVYGVRSCGNTKGTQKWWWWAVTYSSLTVSTLLEGKVLNVYLKWKSSELKSTLFQMCWVGVCWRGTVGTVGTRTKIPSRNCSLGQDSYSREKFPFTENLYPCGQFCNSRKSTRLTIRQFWKWLTCSFNPVDVSGTDTNICVSQILF